MMLSVKSNPLKILPVELSRLSKVKTMELSTENVTFPPPSISLAGTRRILDFLRRADRAWANDVFDLSRLELDSPPLDVITLFPKVTQLFIDRNSITKIPFEFHQMTQLTELRFDEAIMESPSLEIWSFGLQKALEFMKVIFYARLASAPRLDFSRWSITFIPDEVLDPTLACKVMSLDISHNNLDFLPSEISVMSSLTSLTIDNNRLRSLPRQICRLPLLQRLSATCNMLEEFPNHLGELRSLRTLLLQDNDISLIPRSIVQAAALETIDLSRNQIEEFTEGLPSMTSLTCLKVAGNGISVLPFEFGQFTQLRELDVDGNPIWSPPADIMRQPRSVWFAYLDRLTRSQEKLKVKCALWTNRHRPTVPISYVEFKMIQHHDDEISPWQCCGDQNDTALRTPSLYPAFL